MRGVVTPVVSKWCQARSSKIDLAVSVRIGLAFPDEAPGMLGGVVVCSAEDELEDTIRLRLDAAEGDPEKVLALATLQDNHSNRRHRSTPGLQS